MAVKRSLQKNKLGTGGGTESISTLEHLAIDGDKKSKFDLKKFGMWKWVIVIGVLVAWFWYKTGSWPVVAMVGMRPITRFEITQNLMRVYGQEEIENRITEELVRSELERMGVRVEESEIETKITEIKSSLGEGVDFEQILAGRGLTTEEFKKQLTLQMRVEKALADKTTVTDAEVDQYLNDNSAYLTATGEAARTQASEAVRISKLQEEIGKWIEELKTKSKVWKV